MQLLSFLGTGNYQPVRYRLDPGGPAVETRFAAEALAVLLPAEGVSVALTPEAAAHPNYAALAAALEFRGIPCETIAIPAGRDPAELWLLFQTLSAALRASPAAAAPLALDLTHGFRSLPAIALLAAGYLQAAGLLRLQRLYYGAFEARDVAGNTPLFDLTPMLDLPAWGQAARDWLQRADAAPLAQLLRSANNAAWTRAGGSRPRSLGDLASALERFSFDLTVARPQASASAQHLAAALGAALPEVAAYAPPLELLAARIRERVERLGSGGPEAQLELIRLQRDSGHWLAATLLAREWLVGYAATLLAATDRDQAEIALNTGANLPADALAAWSRLRNLRNDLAHCGNKPRPLAPNAIRASLDKSLAALDALARNLAAAATQAAGG